MGAEDVHTWNGDAIELTFRPAGDARGELEFGYSGGAERALAVVDFAASTLALWTSDWRLRQPVAAVKIDIDPDRDHVLRLRKTDGGGNLIRVSDLELFWDGRKMIHEPNQDVLPEMGVRLAVRNQAILARRFVLYGEQPAVPEYLHVGGYQMLNEPSIEQNLEAICRGARRASELGIQLLLTPETSLTGLFCRARGDAESRTRQGGGGQAAQVPCRASRRSVSGGGAACVGQGSGASRTVWFGTTYRVSTIPTARFSPTAPRFTPVRSTSGTVRA